jgi:cytochrome c553
VKGGDGKTVACANCHGPDLRGAGDVPHITGRSPMYVFRQLNDMKLGPRSGPAAEPMRPTVANLTQDDMLAISAYLASRGR